MKRSFGNSSYGQITKRSKSVNERALPKPANSKALTTEMRANDGNKIAYSDNEFEVQQIENFGESRNIPGVSSKYLIFVYAIFEHL